MAGEVIAGWGPFVPRDIHWYFPDLAFFKKKNNFLLKALLKFGDPEGFISIYQWLILPGFHRSMTFLLHATVRERKRSSGPESHFYRGDKRLSDLFSQQNVLMWRNSFSFMLWCPYLNSRRLLFVPVNILMKLPIDALNEGSKQVCVCAESNKMQWY